MMQHSVLGSVVALASASFLFGCRSDILKEEAIVKPTSAAPVARAKVVDGLDCEGKANVVAVPEHCAWPASAARGPIVSVDVQVVAKVTADGKVEDVRVVRSPEGNGFDEAAIACARRAEYQPARGPEGASVPSETCPVTLRLARYVTDIDPTGRDRPCPPSVGYRGPAAASGPATGAAEPLRCP